MLNLKKQASLLDKKDCAIPDNYDILTDDLKLSSKSL